ncbi:hypothetical protein [Methylobacterium brachythecii]|uniref:Lipoprotein n=1 Tax=Methylobacterium brachythecii TaxID=1176177 RepID=A0A7W6AEU1_9HYPH|nr:hypothetical protein [Methylobacterium brachythecii]MBB3901992.1 hypothetical protein [Methylobacterium brachythecii]GLS43374.1 hypothetical protein GCM10007884_13590 [Methylobacterium brachythecii]
MKIVNLIAAVALAGGVAACSKGNDCTPEAITKKSQELMTAIQQKIAADPSSGQELMKKFQEVGVKLQAANNNNAQACLAYDELLKTVK